MGCLPILVLFPLGFGVGYLLGGNAGSLWGAGVGLLLGFIAMGLFIKAMRGKR